MTSGPAAMVAVVSNVPVGLRARLAIGRAEGEKMAERARKAAVRRAEPERAAAWRVQRQGDRNAPPSADAAATVLGLPVQATSDASCCSTRRIPGPQWQPMDDSRSH